MNGWPHHSAFYIVAAYRGLSSMGVCNMDLTCPVSYRTLCCIATMDSKLVNAV